MDLSGAVDIRPAEPGDHDAVEAMTADTWPDRPGGDYLGRVYLDWIRPGDRPKRTLVADVDGRAVAIAQGVMLSDHEAWGQGLRVHPEYRGRGLSTAITAELFDWARSAGATVFRVMVFSWNVAGLGQARASGYDPVCSFRWAHVEPAREPAAGATLARRRPGADDAATATTDDVDVAWSAYRRSDAARALDGLALSMDESWALAELRPEVLDRAGRETAVIAVRGPDAAAGMSYRVRTFERESDGATETVAEYGVAAWRDVGACAAVLDAIAADAAAVGADATRVLIPETPRHVSDVAFLRAEIADEPDFVMAVDLAGTDLPLER